jgi:cytochrome b561
VTRGYGHTAIAFHWTVAALFLGQIARGYATQATADAPALQFSLYQWHKSIGFAVLALAVLRIAWTVAVPQPASAEELAPLERLLARSTRLVLYAATLLVPLTGWAIASSSPLRIPSYVFDLVLVPPLPLPVSEGAEAAWSSAHALLAYCTGVLALAHATAALRHHFILRDGVLARMLPMPARPRR